MAYKLKDRKEKMLYNGSVYELTLQWDRENLRKCFCGMPPFYAHIRKDGANFAQIDCYSNGDDFSVVPMHPLFEEPEWIVHFLKSDINTIFHAVQQSGCCGFSDDEVYSMAVHAIDEPDLEIGKPMDCNVVVNHHIELTEEEKAEQRAIALKRYQEEEMRKLQQRNSRPKVAKPQPKPIQELSLFQGMEL